MGDLSGMERCLERERLLLGIAVGPRRSLTRLLDGPHLGEGLAPDDGADVRRTRLDPLGCADQELQGGGATDARGTFRRPGRMDGRAHDP